MQSSQLFCRERLGPVTSALPSVQTGHPGLSACPPDGELVSYLEAEFLVLFCVLMAVSSGAFFCLFCFVFSFKFLLLPVILVHLPGPIARIQGG